MLYKNYYVVIIVIRYYNHRSNVVKTGENEIRTYALFFCFLFCLMKMRR